MKGFMLLLLSVFLSAVIVPTSAIAGPKSVGGEHLPFEAVKIIIEFNSTARDVGVQLFFDADEAWKNVTVVDPNGLEEVSCECFRLIKDQEAELLN